MILYIHKGHAGSVGVIADSEDEAIQYIRESLDSMGLVEEEIVLPLQKKVIDKTSKGPIFTMRKYK